MPFYIQKTKWTEGPPPRVTIIHNGPFEKREDAVNRMNSLRRSKHTDLSIIEKETNT